MDKNNAPRLWRLACELSGYKDPHKALDLMIALAGVMQEEVTP